MPVCIVCNNAFEVEDKVYRLDDCPHCGADLHACKQCRFYEPGRNNDCREPRAERVVEKDKANFCGYFEIRPDGEDAPGKFEADAAKAKLAALFKK